MTVNRKLIIICAVEWISSVTMSECCLYGQGRTIYANEEYLLSRPVSVYVVKCLLHLCMQTVDCPLFDEWSMWSSHLKANKELLSTCTKECCLCRLGISVISVDDCHLCGYVGKWVPSILPISVSASMPTSECLQYQHVTQWEPYIPSGRGWKQGAGIWQFSLVPERDNRQ